jgi:hypothetical protein
MTVGQANATLTLTPAGIADGFSLSAFYSDPGVQYGLLGITTTASGQVIGVGYARNELYLFNDVDGQNFGTRLLTVATPGTPTSAATAGGITYVGILGGQYYSVNTTTLALTPLLLAGVTARYGLWANPVTGHLLAATNLGLLDINPLTATFVLVGSPGGNTDGVTVSPDGQTAYVETNSSTIYAYSLVSINPTTPVATYTLLHSPDGTAVVSGSSFNGDIVVNNNDGTVGLLDPTTDIETIIASGGSRGDLVGPDLINGSLFLTFYEGEERLSIAGGCIGIACSTSVPEPASLAFFVGGIAGLAALSRRRKAKA